ncbi:MAG: hypothetical protein ACOYYS_20255 [Chloroflexota bacterium]
MGITGNLASLMLVFVVVVIVAAVLFVWLMARARQVDLTSTPSPNEVPEWLATRPPVETIAATQADGEGITLYDHDAGERIASPFAEQIEDIARALIAADPALSSTRIDFGTAPDGTLEIWVGDKRYGEIDALPDERLRAIMHEAVARFSQGDYRG